MSTYYDNNTMADTFKEEEKNAREIRSIKKKKVYFFFLHKTFTNSLRTIPVEKLKINYFPVHRNVY